MTTNVKNIFSGDPLLFLGNDGSNLKFVEGQPVMDQGFENFVTIALFTEPGWAGNDLFRKTDQKIGSGFLSATRKSITLQSLNDIRNEAEKALQHSAFGKVTVNVTNPRASQIDVLINIQPPGQDSQTILLSRDGLNWLAQATVPAHREI